MPDLVAQAIRRLSASGVRLDRGLSDKEVSLVEDRFRFSFGPEHREFLQEAVPVGGSWPDWRNDSEDDLRGRVDWPIDGIIFDVHKNGFWPGSWGDRPDKQGDREREARAHLARVPKLVPVFSHRYLASDPLFAPSPVFSVYQTDIIFYGDNLLDYVAHEFHAPPLHPSGPYTCVVLVAGCRGCREPRSVSGVHRHERAFPWHGSDRYALARLEAPSGSRRSTVIPPPDAWSWG